MKLIELKCPSCGAKLTVSNQLKKFTCNYCGTTTMLDDEIIKIEHTFNNLEKEEIFKRIDGFIKLDNYHKAIEESEELKKKYSYDPKTWIYLIKCVTHNYNTKEPFDYSEVLEYLDNYKKVEEDEIEKNANLEKIEDYINRSKIEKYINTTESESITYYCPFCDDEISFGERKCKSCNKELYWKYDE